MEEDAIARICEETRGYPYFIQEWGSQLWNFIEREPITAVARALDVAQSAIAQRRASLIRKGMIYSPAHGKLAFTVPLFPDFVKRNEANVNEM